MRMVTFDEFKQKVSTLPENEGVTDLQLYQAWDESFGKPQRQEIETRDGAFGFSIDQAQNMLGAGVRTVGQATGLESVERFGQGVMDQQEQDIKEGRYTPKYQGSLSDNWTEGGIGQAVGWLGEKALENAAISGGALAGGALAAAVAPFSLPLSAALMGGTSVMSGLAITGETAMEMEEKGVDVNPATAVATGVIGGLFERFGLGRFFSRGQFEKMRADEAIEELLKRGETGAAEAIGTEIARRTGVEIATELGQESTIVGATALEGGEYTGGELADRALDTAALAGVISAPASTAATVKDYATRPADSDIQARIAELRARQEQAATDAVSAAEEVTEQVKADVVAQGGDALDVQMAESEARRSFTTEVAGATKALRETDGLLESVREQARKASEQIAKRTTPYQPDERLPGTNPINPDFSVFPDSVYPGAAVADGLRQQSEQQRNMLGQLNEQQDRQHLLNDQLTERDRAARQQQAIDEAVSLQNESEQKRRFGFERMRQAQQPLRAEALQRRDAADQPGATAVDVAATEAALSPQNDLPEPTDAQKEAGNYKMGKVKIAGLDISIENQKGSVRKGADKSGEQWENQVQSHYGYIRGTVGRDKDHVDVFLGDNTEAADRVFVIDQVDPDTGTFDEHKVMMGYDDEMTARDAYAKNYNADWKGLGNITEMPMDEFKSWVRDPKNTIKPVTKIPQRLMSQGFEAGRTAKQKGMPKELPSYFKNKTGKDAKDWLKGWDSTSATAFSTQDSSAARKIADDQGLSGSDGAGRAIETEQAENANQEITDQPEQAARRQTALRQNIDEMQADDKDRVIADLRRENEVTQKRLYTSEVTGNPNRLAYEDSEKKAFVASIDVDALKWVNDNMGHQAGDALLKEVGNALSASGLEVYHVSGDEFIAQSNDKADIDRKLSQALESLGDINIEAELPDGRVIKTTQAGFSYGIGNSLNQAEAGLRANKAGREEQGLRATRGREPAGVVRSAAEGSQDQGGEVQVEQQDPPNNESASEYAVNESRSNTIQSRRQDNIEGVAFSPAVGRDRQVELFTADNADKKQSYADLFGTIIKAKPVSQVRASSDTASTAAELADMLASIRKDPQENFYAVATGGGGKVLRVMRFTRGTHNSSMVIPLDVVAEAATIEGIQKLHYAHNHPSGDPEPSQSDERITDKLNRMLDGTGIEPGFHVVIGKNTWDSVASEAGESALGGATPLSPQRRTVSVPVTERRFTRRGTLSAPITDADKAISATANHDHAIFLLDNENAPVAVLPMTPGEMQVLREGGRVSRILSAISKANASSAIIKSNDREAAVNVSKMLNSFESLNVLDWIDDQGSSDAAKGGDVVNQRGPFYSKRNNNAKPVAVLDGSEITETGAGYFENVKNYFDKKLRGKVFKTQIGNVTVTGKSWRKLKYGINGKTIKGDLIPAIPDILSKGAYVGSSDNVKPRRDDIFKWHYFEATVQLDGKRVIVRLSIGEDGRGKLTYNLANSADDRLQKEKGSGETQGIVARAPKPLESSLENDQGSEFTQGRSRGSDPLKSSLADGLNITILSDDLSVNSGMAKAKAEVLLTKNKLLALAIKKGKLKVVQSASELPESANILGSDDTVQGAYLNGTAYVVADGNTERSINSTAWHELTHAAMDTHGDTFITPDVKAKLFNRLENQIKLDRNSKKDSPLKRTISRTEQAETSNEDYLEEVAGYLVTDYVNEPDTFTGAIKQWVQDFIGAIQAAVLRHTGVQIGRVSGAELNAIARAYADYVTKPDRGRELSMTSQVQFPSVSGSIHGLNKKILTEADVVNSRKKPLLSRAPTAEAMGPSNFAAPDNAYDRAFESLGDKDKTVFSRAKQLLKRELLPGGLLPDTVFRAKIQRDSELNGMEFDIANRTGRLDKAIQKAYGKPYKDMGEADLLKINEALASKDPDMSLPEAVREQIYVMRGMIRGLSQKYANHLQSEIELLQADGDNAEAASKAQLLETILNNLDTYVHRSYRAFDDPQWPRKVPRETYDAAARYLEGQYADGGKVTPEIEDRVSKTIELMLEEGTAFDSMEAFIKESKLGAKDLSVLQRRKQVAPEIRELLGEYKDPKVNFTKSVTKMARLVFNQSFLDQVREIGLRDGFLFEKENRPLDATRRIAADASEAYAPLNGLYTFPEIDQAFKDALGKEQMADWFRAIIRANGMVKFGKTVLSPTTAARNWMSAMFFALANGHFDFSQIRNSVGSLREYFSQTGNKADYLKKLKQLGVIYDTPYAGEMMDLLSDSNLESSLFDKKPFTNIRQAVEFAQKFYQYGDDFWKIMGYENEKALLIKHKGLSEAAAEKEAAERIRNTYPTYSMTGRFVQRLRRFPLAGTFVSFPAEIIRTSYHIMRYMRQDLKDTPALGRRKVAGFAIASGAIHGMQTLAMGLMGMTDDEEEAFRDLAAPWQRNSNIIPLGYDEDGKIRLIDMSFLDPYNYWKRPINAMLRDQPFQDAAVDSAKEMLSPFFGEDIAYGAMSEVMNNKKASGGRVFNPNAPVADQTADIANHLRKALQPGALANAERIIKAASGEVSASGRPYTMKDEMAALVGFRITTFDAKSSIYYKAFEFQDKKRDATSIFNSIARNPNDISGGQLTRAYENAVTTRIEAYEEMMRLIKAAMASGLTRSEAIRTLRNSGVSKTDSLALVQGRIPAWKPSSQSMRNAVKRADVLFDPKITARLKERQELIRKQFMAGGQ